MDKQCCGTCEHWGAGREGEDVSDCRPDRYVITRLNEELSK